MVTPARSIQSGLVILVLLIAAVFLARKPYYNWDMFPYMALVMRQHDVPFDSTHRLVYAQARSHMLARDVEAISSRQPTLMADAKAFEEVLPYYEIKPGYTFLARAFYKLGINPLAATWLPSILGYFFLCTALFLWSSTRAPVPAAGLFTAIIATSTPMTDLARYSSPDMLCTCTLMIGILLLLESRTMAGMVLCTLSVLIRPDAVLLVIPVIASVFKSGKLSVQQALGWCTVNGVVLVLLFGWNSLLGQYMLVELSGSERMQAYIHGFATMIDGFAVSLTLLAVALLFIRRRKFPKLLSFFLMASLFSMATRFLLHPFVEDRFNLSAYLTILVVAWATLTNWVYRPTGMAKT